MTPATPQQAAPGGWQHWLMPPGDVRQATRMRRFYYAAVTTLVLVALLVWWRYSGRITHDVMWVALGSALSVILLVFGLFRSGLNQRFTDPSLTAEQIVLSSTVLLYVAHHVAGQRALLVFFMLAVFATGVFNLRTRQLVHVALFDLLGYALVIVWPPRVPAPDASLEMDLLLWGGSAGVLFWFSWMAGQVVALRNHVERRNRELGDAVDRLEQRQVELAGVQRLAKLGNWSIDLRNGAVVWSDEQYRILGIDPAGYVPEADSFKHFVHYEDRLAFGRYVAESLRTGEDSGMEARLVRADGALRWARMERHSVTGADGMIERQYGTVVDITEAKQSESRLRMQHAVTQVLAESRSLSTAIPAILRSISEAQDWAAAACWRVARDGENLRCVDVWNLDEPALQAFSAQLPARQLPLAKVAGLMARSYLSGVPQWVEDVTLDPGYLRGDAARAAALRGVFTLPVVSGSTVLRVLEFYSHDARAPDANLIELSRSLGNQIGQFIERRSAEAALEMARERLDLAVRASGIGFWEIKTGPGMPLHTAYCSALLGYAEGELPTEFEEFLKLVHRDDLPLLRAKNVEGAKSGKPYTLDMRLRHRSGRYRWYRGNAQAVIGPDGRAVRVTGSLSDIEETRQLERAKGEFIATVSHELRTPLTSIRGALGLLDGGVAGELPDDAKELVRTGLSGAERLSLLVNDVLYLAKIESGTVPMTLAPVALDALTAAAVAANGLYCQKFEVQLRGECGTSGALVQADADRMMQVLTNLISNAAKFSPPGAQVCVRSVRAGRRLRAEVIDHGRGIPEAFRERMFEKFTQVDGSDAREQQGSGLGLNICHALVTQMGGVIDFTDTPGGGTTFFVELPEYSGGAVQGEPPAAPVGAAAKGGAAAVAGSASTRITQSERTAS